MWNTLEAISSSVSKHSDDWDNLSRAAKLTLLKAEISKSRTREPDYFT